MILCYMQGSEPPPEEDITLSPCPFLTEEGLCRVYPYRPLMCRLMASIVPCSQGQAEIPPFLFKVSTISLQLVENLDIGGVYGNFFDLLRFLDAFKKGKEEEVPNYLLSNVDVDDLPILPEEKDLKKWVGDLYRTEVIPGKTFRDLLQELRLEFQSHQSLSFLRDIF